MGIMGTTSMRARLSFRQTVAFLWMDSSTQAVLLRWQRSTVGFLTLDRFPAMQSGRLIQQKQPLAALLSRLDPVVMGHLIVVCVKRPLAPRLFTFDTRESIISLLQKQFPSRQHSIVLTSL